MKRIRRPSAATLKILKCLSMAHEGMHGYALMKGSGLASGTLYPILGRLADRGWLEKAWETHGAISGPPRRIYTLTALGRKQFELHAKDTAVPAGELKLGVVK